MSLRVSESGKTMRIFAGIDLTANTQIELTLVAPDKTVITRTRTSGALRVGTVAVDDPDVGHMPAGQYVEYDIEPELLTLAGNWKGALTYSNTNVTPPDRYVGGAFKFFVSALVGAV